MGTLAITFQGPFVSSIGDGWVKVYSPICDNHHAAVFTVDDEYPLCGRAKHGGSYIYKLNGTGIQPNTGTIEYPKGRSDILDGPKGSQIEDSQAKFCLMVPIPDAIYGINPASTEVVKNDKPTNTMGLWATGLRFYYYECDLTKLLVLKTPEGEERPFSLNHLAAFTDYGDVDIRHVGPDANDAEHTDAISCFDRTMKLLGHPWWLSYGQGSKTFVARIGSDCRSPHVILGHQTLKTRNRHNS